MTATDFRGDHSTRDAHSGHAAPVQTPDSAISATELQRRPAESEQISATTNAGATPKHVPSSRATLPAAIVESNPNADSRRDHSSDPASGSSDPHLSAAGSEQASRSHRAQGAQTDDAAASTSDPARTYPDSHIPTAGSEQTENGSAAIHVPDSSHQTLADPFLALAADIVDDLERTRIANENRLRMLTRAEVDEDGEMRGLGMDERDPNVARTAALVDMLAKAEHQAVLNLNKLLREHPLGPWIKAQKGVGEKTAARLLAVVGDPYLNMATGEVRTISQLWAYCGHGDPDRRKFKGMSQDDLFRLGNPTAKKRVWLIATAILKAGGGEEKAILAAHDHTTPASLASVYYQRKAATEGREHATECVRCGPSGEPAQPGSPWSDAHRHADALRIVGKEFLRELWIEAKRIHVPAAGEGMDQA